MDKKKTYTVKQVSHLSGVSVRALHFYDEIGLLKPSYYGQNGYRYYEKSQLLLLQQILFYKELGFDLSAIQKILSDPSFDKIKALRSHREELLKTARKTETLIETIDKTIRHLQKERNMDDDEIYKGFDPKKQAEYEQYIIEKYGENGRKKIEESKRRTKNWSKDQFDEVKNEYHKLHLEFAQLIQRGLKANGPEAQILVRQHYQVVSRFWTPNRQAYIGLGQLYCEHADFRKLYDSYHPELATFLAEAMRVYAEAELT